MPPTVRAARHFHDGHGFAKEQPAQQRAVNGHGCHHQHGEARPNEDVCLKKEGVAQHQPQQPGQPQPTPAKCFNVGGKEAAFNKKMGDGEEKESKDEAAAVYNVGTNEPAAVAE